MSFKFDLYVSTSVRSCVVVVHQGYEIDVFCFRGEEIIQILF